MAEITLYLFRLLLRKVTFHKPAKKEHNSEKKFTIIDSVQSLRNSASFNETKSSFLFNTKESTAYFLYTYVYKCLFYSNALFKFIIMFFFLHHDPLSVVCILFIEVHI